MLIIPAHLQKQYADDLIKKGFTDNDLKACLKWLRYYLDFCAKYGLKTETPASLPAFINKLAQKNQPNSQQQQAARAIQLFHEIGDRKHDSEIQKPTSSENLSSSGLLHEARKRTERPPQSARNQHENNSFFDFQNLSCRSMSPSTKNQE